MRIRFVVTTLLLSIFLIYSVINLGRFLDIKQRPKPSDVIACLSGCNKYRMAKTVELYRQGYVKQNIIILTSPEPLNKETQSNAYCKKYAAQLKKEHIAVKPIICTEQISNTMQELLAVKAYLLSHHLQSALIVADPPTTRRASLLADKVAGFDADGLKAIIIGSDAPWWDREHYWKDRVANVSVAQEIVKLPYNLIKYGILYNLFEQLGILEPARKLLSPMAGRVKRDFGGFLWGI